MPWKSIIAGVDGSRESAWAATVAWNVARAAGAECYLVHACKQAADIPVWVEPIIDIAELEDSLIAQTTSRLEEQLTGNVPFESLRNLEVRLGRPKRVLAQAAADRKAELVVLGGKQGSSRKFGSSTAFHVIQTVDVPTLIAVPSTSDPRRVLAAMDLSHAAGPTVGAAQELADFLGAELKVIHVVEPMPDIPSYTIDLPEDQNIKRAEEHFAQTVVPLINGEAAHTAVLPGPTEETITRAAEDWNADIVVIGSHGKGWLERVLLGSTTRRLIKHMPASLLVVPVPEP
ncbi:MAG: universal stress protein [Gemmatimonadota bacterium]|nr:MAG: universal stress protein [Gemmatimonadota bacterium]